jgi:hypothetical protein
VNQRLRESLAAPAPADLGRAPLPLSLSVSLSLIVEGRGKGPDLESWLCVDTELCVCVAVAFSLFGPLAVAFLARARPGGAGRGVDSSMAALGPHALRPLAHRRWGTLSCAQRVTRLGGKMHRRN